MITVNAKARATGETVSTGSQTLGVQLGSIEHSENTKPGRSLQALPCAYTARDYELKARALMRLCGGAQDVETRQLITAQAQIHLAAAQAMGAAGA